MQPDIVKLVFNFVIFFCEVVYHSSLLDAMNPWGKIFKEFLFTCVLFLCLPEFFHMHLVCDPSYILLSLCVSLCENGRVELFVKEESLLVGDIGEMIMICRNPLKSSQHI